MSIASVLVDVAGGIGLFLLGMSLMTEGLKSMAGESVRKALMRFTRSPGSGVLTGVLATIVTQSSSVTIVITVGFVGAGILAYSQALSVVLGASIGSTFIGWLVAIVGFKLQLGAIASVMILIGAFLRLFGGTRRSGLAYSLAGFGLVFVGIVNLQAGMAGVQEHVDLGFISASTFSGKLTLVAIGLAFTLITQSSAAGVISTLAALHSGVVDFEQAAALVVGMNVGTTFTSAVATIGGNVHVRRTGFSHVVFNAIVSGCAIFLITPYMWLWQTLMPSWPLGSIALVSFHTLFNLVGVMLILPFIHQYARFIERLFPEPVSQHTDVLDPSLLRYPELALAEVQKVLAAQIKLLAAQLEYILGESTRAVPLAATGVALDDVRQYLDKLHLDSSAGKEWERLLASIHLLDHLQRLYDRCQNQNVILILHTDEELRSARLLLLQLVQNLVTRDQLDEEQANLLVDQLEAQESHLRQLTMRRIANGQIELKHGISLMETGRWMHRVGWHLTRIDHNLEALDPAFVRETEVAR